MKTSGDALNGSTVTLTAKLRGNEEVISELERIEGVEVRIDGDTVVITTRVDGTEESHQRLESLQVAMNAVDGRDIHATVHVDGTTESIAEAEAVDEALNRIAGRDARAQVHVDGAREARTDVDNLSHSLDDSDTSFTRLRKNVRDSDSDYNLFSSSLRKAGTEVANLGRTEEGLDSITQGLRKNFGVFRGEIVLWGGVIVAAMAAVQPLLGGLTALGGLVTAGAAGFGLMAGGAVDLGQKLLAVDKQTTKVKDATTNLAAAEQELNDAYAKGDPAAIKAARKDIKTTTEALAQEEAELTVVIEQQGQSVADLYNSWKTFKAALPGTFEAPAQALASLGSRLLDLGTQALPSVKTAAEQTASAFEVSFGRVIDLFSGERMTGAFQKILDAAAPVFANLTEAAGNFGAGVISVFSTATTAAIPLSSKLNDIAISFANWATSKEGIDQINGAIEAAAPVFSSLWESAKGFTGALIDFSTNHQQGFLDFLKGVGEFGTDAVTTIDKIVYGIGQIQEKGQPAADALNALNKAAGGAAEKARKNLDQLNTEGGKSLSELDEKVSQSAGNMRLALPAGSLTAEQESTINFKNLADKAAQELGYVDESARAESEKWRTTLADGAGAAREDTTSEFEGMETDATSNFEDTTASAETEAGKWGETLPGGAEDAHAGTSPEFEGMETDATSNFEDTTKSATTEADNWRTTLPKGAEDAKTGTTEQYTEMASKSDGIFSQMTSTLTGWVNTLKTNVVSAIRSMVADSLAELNRLTSAANYVLSFLPGSIKIPSLSTGNQSPRGGITGGVARAKGGVDDNAEPQGPTGGVSDGMTPRVVYGEQKRRVKEAYIVEDRPDNIPYLQEAASWHGYTLVKMAGGGITSQPSHQVINSDGSTSGSGTTPATGSEPAIVPTPTPSEQQPYTDAALGQYAMIPVPAADYVGDHVNVPDTTTSGDLGGVAQGGSVPSVWPSLAMTAGPTASVGPWAKAGPAFAMATGGMTGGTPSAVAAKPVPYTGVPVNWWDTFLGASWTGDPALDWPILYPPSGWDPSQVFAPAAMARGGILRRGTRYFQGGGLNQSQIDAGISAGSSVIGSPYSYGSAGEDGGFDCAGIWNYIEAAVAYGAPQTGKRWGTYDAAAGSAGSFTTPGLTPGGVNIGVNLSGEGGPDDTHMAGDIGSTTFESTVPTGVTNGRGADSFGTQYTMGGAGEVAGQVGPGQAFDPASNMTQQVADWWNSAYGQTPTTNQQSNTQTDIQKVNDDTGQTSSGGGSSGEDPESSGTGTGSGGGLNRGGGVGGNLRGPGRGGGRGHRGGIPSRGARKKARKRKQRRFRRQHRMAGGGILMDGVENWMANLPGVTQDYLTNVGLQTLGTLGGVSGSPIGTSTRDWVIAGLEAAGLDPTEEAIGILESLIGAESGGDPNAVGPNGEQGILQLMPETWDQYNVGGSATDPVANIAASIRYQLARYGQLVNFSPYEKGGMALSPHLGMVGEAGNEVMLPLENRMVMANLRAGLGTGDLEASMGQLAKHVDRVAERVDHQTDVIPERTGVAVGGGVDKRIVRNPKTRKAIISSGDVEARRALHAGR